MRTTKSQLFIFSILLLGGICFFINNHILTITIPLYSLHLGLDLSLIGYINSAMGGMIIILKFLTPQIFKKYNIKTIVIFSYILLIIISCVFLFATDGFFFIIFRTLYGIPFALFPFFYLLLIKKISLKPEQIVKHTSIAGLAMPTSMILSPIIAEALIEKDLYQIAFFLALASSILSFVFLAICINFIRNTDESPTEKKNKVKIKDVYIHIKGLILPLVIFSYLGALDMMVLNYFPAIAQNTSSLFSHYFVLFSIAMIITQIYMYKNKTNLQNSLRLGYFFLSISQLLIYASYFNYYYSFSTLSAILFGCGFGLVETNTNSLILIKSDAKSYNYLMAAQQLIITFGRTVTPYLISSFASNLESIVNTFFACTIIGIVPIAFLTIWKKNN